MKKSKSKGISHTFKASEPQPRRLLQRIVSILLILILGAVAYSSSLTGEFVLDDRRNITDNLLIRTLAPTRAGFIGPPWTSYTARPVAMFTLALNYRIHGERVLGYHLVNVGIHLLAALALYGVIRRTLGLPRLQTWFRGREDWLATIISLIWVLHPLNTASVSYISQRVESLMGMFCLVSCYCFIRGATGRHRWYYLSVIAFVLGIGSKEPMASLPLILLIYDRTLLADSFKQAMLRRRWLYVALFATWLPFVILHLPHLNTGDISLGFNELSGLDYLKTQAKVILLYLWLAFWPRRLILYYGWANYDVPILRTFPQYAPWGAAILALLGFTFWAVYQRKPIGILGVWFFVILAPSSSIISMPTEVISEQRMYLPLIAVVTGVVLNSYVLGCRLIGLLPFQVVAPIVSYAGRCLIGMVVLTLAIATYRQNEKYRTSRVLWTDILQKMPRNSAALSTLGIQDLTEGRLEDAERLLRQALDVCPESSTSLVALGLVHERRGRLSEALEQYRSTVQLKPGYPDAYKHLVRVLVMQNKVPEAIDVLATATRLFPWEQDLHITLGTLLVRSGRMAEGKSYLDRAIKIDPDPVHAHTALGQYLAQLGVADLALHHLRAATALASQDPQTYVTLGMTLAENRDLDGAVKAYHTALALAPDDDTALNNLAWIRATAPDASARDGAEAVRLSEHAVALSKRQNPSSLDTLAAAYAEIGRFDLAISTVEEALMIAARDRSMFLPPMQERLQLYRSTKPYREQPPASAPSTIH